MRLNFGDRLRLVAVITITCIAVALLKFNDRLLAVVERHQAAQGEP